MGERKLLVLIDSGSMHGFLNEATALELRCKMIATTPLSVTLANGSKMYSHNKVKGSGGLCKGRSSKLI